MMKQTLLIAALSLTQTFAHAFEVKTCEENNTTLMDLVSPVAKNVREFYNGQVQVFLVDHIEPACCSSGVAVTMFKQDAELPGEKVCYSIHQLTGADVAKARASYDKSKGLLLTIPLRSYDPDS